MPRIGLGVESEARSNPTRAQGVELHNAICIALWMLAPKAHSALTKWSEAMDAHTQNAQHVLRILRMRSLPERTGLSKSTIYTLIAAGKFPISIKLGSRAVGWYEHEINQWLADRANASAK